MWQNLGHEKKWKFFISKAAIDPVMETSIQKICCPRATNHFSHRNVLPAQKWKKVSQVLEGLSETHS